MTYDYLFDLANEAFEADCHARFTVKEDHGRTIFPRIETSIVDGQKKYTLLFNRKIEALLSLYNAALVFGIDSTDAIAEYLMAQESIDADEYEYAEGFLEALKKTLEEKEITKTLNERSLHLKIVTAFQVLYILLHEISHEVINQDPEHAKNGIGGSKIIVNEMWQELNEELNDESLDEMAKNEYVAEMCKNEIPKNCSEEERMLYVRAYLEHSFAETKPSDFLESLLNGADDAFLTEMACDRNAYAIMMRWLLPYPKQKDEITALLMMAYIGLLAMDYAAIFQSYSRVFDSDEERYRIQQKNVLRNRNTLNSIKIYMGGLTEEGLKGLNEIDKTISTLITRMVLLAGDAYSEVIANIRDNRDNQKDTQLKRVLDLKRESDAIMAGVVAALDGDVPDFFKNITLAKMRGHWLIKGLQKIGYDIIAAKLLWRKLWK